MRLLVFAAIYQFGLECGVGAGKLSLFFKLIRIHDHVGVSESALRTQIQQMELLLPQFQAVCEQQANTQKRKAVVAMDETFFGEFLILVLMDLSSGYLLLEDISDDRCYETWYAKTSPRLEALGIEVSHAISDRAKALIKLAVTGFECDSGADLFHAQQDLSRRLGPKLARQSGSRYFCESFYGHPCPTIGESLFLRKLLWASLPNKRQKLRDRLCLRRPQPSCFTRCIPNKGYATSLSQ